MALGSVQLPRVAFMPTASGGTYQQGTERRGRRDSSPRSAQSSRCSSRRSAGTADTSSGSCGVTVTTFWLMPSFFLVGIGEAFAYPRLLEFFIRDALE